MTTPQRETLIKAGRFGARLLKIGLKARPVANDLVQKAGNYKLAMPKMRHKLLRVPASD
jgi:hypothetical protein